MRKMPFYSATEHLWKEAKSRLQYSYECIFTCIFKVILVRLLQVGGKPLRQWQIATERQKNNAVRISIIGKMIPYAELTTTLIFRTTNHAKYIYGNNGIE